MKHLLITTIAAVLLVVIELSAFVSLDGLIICSML